MKQETINILTFAIGGLGVVLGVINTIHSITKDKLKAKIRPVFVHPIRSDGIQEKFIGLDITNLSNFPISISQIGFILKGMKDRRVITLPLSSQGTIILPIKLDSREQITLFGKYDEIKNEKRKIICGYCITACGKTFKGKSKVIRHLNENK